MTTIPEASAKTYRANVLGVSALTWISHGLEAIWLAVALLVPLAFLSPDYAVSEARISYVEVPKVALLRVLAGSSAILWALEWAIRSNAFQRSLPSISFAAVAAELRPLKIALAIMNWLQVHPTRWLLFAALMFFGSTFLSTALSGSPRNSVWGEIPGQDGYSAYTIASYAIVFAVIATHLKTRAQLARLLATIVIMGTIVGLYASFQHFGNDFLGINEETGGGASRVTGFMGNAIFAATVLAMTIPATVLAAAFTLQYRNWGDWAPLARFGRLGKDSVLTVLWSSVAAVQLLGLMFTFSRGPWGGALLALVVFIGLVGISFGWQLMLRVGLVLGLAGIFSVAFLHSQSSVSIISFGPWLGYVLALVSLAVTVVLLYIVNRYGRAARFIMVTGVVVIISGAQIFGPSALSGRGALESASGETASKSTGGEISDRIASIPPEVLSGFTGGRGTHWSISWELIRDRPWFEFDELNLSWLRGLVGYGPDLFRYTYLLRSPAEEDSKMPLEPDHAHNFFIHQTVEQGVLGGLASLSIFLTVIGITGRHILRSRNSGNPVYRLILFGLTAIIFGRFLEMMVGVARISDLTILWIIFGLLAASVHFDSDGQAPANDTADQPAQPPPQQLNRRAQRASAAPIVDISFIIRMSMVAIFIGVVGGLTWVKGVNPVRASVAEGRALKHYRAGELESAVVQLDRAIELAPDVSSYYNNRAAIFLMYQLRPDQFTEPACNQQTEVPYSVCLGVQGLESNLVSAERQPFNFRSHLATANSAFNLRLSETAVEYYDKATKMVPNGWMARLDLAESLIDIGSYEQAVRELDRVLDIIGETDDSSLASVLKGRALWSMGRPDEAIDSLNIGITMGGRIQENLDVIGEINEALGYELDTQHFTQLLDQNPLDAAAHVFRGRAYFLRGEYVDALKDIDVGISMGLGTPELLAKRGYLRLKTGNPAGAHSDLFRAIDSSPQNALYNAHIGAFHLHQMEFALAIDSLEKAITLDPGLGLAYLIRSQVYTALKLKGTAKEFLDISKGLDLPTSQDYADRGVIFAFLGEYPSALSDIDEAIKINPDQADYYNIRAKIHAIAGNFPSSLVDFDTAIQLNPEADQYLLNRGVLFDILGSTDRSLSDFETAQSIGGIDLPEPVGRSLAYFATYTDDLSIDEKLEDFRRLNNKRNKILDTGNLNVGPEARTYRVTLQSLGQASLALFRWNSAIEILSELIELSPDEPEAYKHRGDAYLGLRNYSEATIDYSRAVGLDPANSTFLTARGKAYAESGQMALARNDLNQALQIDPKSSDAHNLLGFLSVQSKDYSQAFADSDRALAISLLSHQAHFIQATAYTGLGQIPAALEAIGQSINLAPNNPEYYYVRGLLREELGDHELAINDFEHAIALVAGVEVGADPKLSRPFFSRGQAHLELGNQNQAVLDAVRIMEFLTDNFNTPEWNGHLPDISSQLADARQLLSDSLRE